MEFKETVAMVTGAARGIGKEIARLFHARGAQVVILDLKQDDVEQAAKEIANGGEDRVLPIECNVSDEASVVAAMKHVKEKLGKLDILVNNAGITRDNLFLRMKFEQWQSVIDVNLTGTYLCARHAAPLLRKSRRGRIINLSSVAAQGNPGQANYAASKAGVIGLTKTLALELARYHVTVNAIAPGFIETDMTKAIPEKARNAWLERIPLGRAGAVGDVAEAVLFLASENSAYITGQVLGVDGGLGK